MKIVVDNEYTQKVRDKIISHFKQRESTEGKWHVSDLLMPRWGYFTRVTADYRPSEEDIGFFANGTAWHEFIQKVLGPECAEQQGEFLNIIGTCDWLDRGTGAKDLTEIKTSRKWTVPDDPEDHYVDQAGQYCVIFKKKKARIFVIYPVSGRKWDGSQSSSVEFRSWTVEFSDKDLEEIRADMAVMGGALDEALLKKDHTLLPTCPLWKCGRKWKKAFKICPFYEICKPEDRYPIEILKRLVR